MTTRSCRIEAEPDFTACAQAADGKQGIELAKEIHPDVISLDLSMPVMNGLEAASKLRKIFPTTPRILFSLYAETLWAKEASNAGVSVVLSENGASFRAPRQAHKLMGDLLWVARDERPKRSS